MTATRSPSARTLERHGAVPPPCHARWELLEDRLLFARSALSGDAEPADNSYESPSDAPAGAAFVSHESKATAAPTAADSNDEPTTNELATKREADGRQGEPASDAETRSAPIRHREPEFTDSATPHPDDAPRSRDRSTAMEPGRPVQQGDQADWDKSKRSGSKTDTNADRAEAAEPHPACVRDTAEDRSISHCAPGSQSMAQSPDRGYAAHTAVALRDAESEAAGARPASNAAMVVAETLAALREPVPRAEASAAEQSLPDEATMHQVLADAVSNVIRNDGLVAAESEWSPGVVAAGTFAVVFAKPISRLSSLDPSTAGDPALAPGIPVLFPRRRRRPSGTSRPGTDELPDEEDGDDDAPTRRHRHPLDSPVAARADNSPSGDRYAAIERAIDAALLDRDAAGDNSRCEQGALESARSVAAGALAATAAWLTFQRGRSPDRSRDPIHPALPTYHGVTRSSPVRLRPLPASR